MAVGAEIHDLRRLRKRKAFPIPPSACQIIGMLGGSTQQVGQPSFSLRRRRERVQIMFLIGTGGNTSFSWNVTELLDLNHQSFSEARKWAHAYAAGFGHSITEHVSYRKPRPKGDDGKAFRAGECKEQWLASEMPDLWAAAMMRCQHPGGHCGEDGYCHYGTCDMEMEALPPDS